MTDLNTSLIDAIHDFTVERGYPPTLRELMDRVQSPSFKMVHRSLNDLREAGIVTWEKGTSRTLRVVQYGESSTG